MMRARPLAWIAALGLAMALSAGAPAAAATPELEERLISDAAQDSVAITATFAGSELFVFGAVSRNRPLAPGESPPEVIVVVRGPSSPVIVRKKARVAGVWLNREAVRIAAAPSYYAVAGTKPLAEILAPEEDRTHRISLDQAVVILGIPLSAQDPEEFRQAAIRLREAEGLYSENPGGVSLKDGVLYQTRLHLPANIVEGDYAVRVYLLRDGRVRDQGQIKLPVRRQGVERFVYVSATETPFLYGIATLLTALFAGWAASEAFRRLRR